MADTESSDFLSSSDSIYSVGSTTSDRVNGNYVDFDVFLSDGLGEANRAEVYENIGMHPNSRLSNTDHPVLIRLENEYQARRSYFHQRPGQYCTYLQEIERRISCPRQTNLTSRGSPRVGRKEDGHLNQYGNPKEAELETPQELKRQLKRSSDSPSDWWKERQELNLPKSEGDIIFAKKCQELQGFVKPLTELLNGLKRGRYDRGLSSFQQSVAMDRIQRIIGVLQKPEMGERYLDTLLQVEIMLKVWFPGVAHSSSSPSSSSDYDMEEPQCKMAKSPSVAEVSQYPLGNNSVVRPTEAPLAAAHPDSNCENRKDSMHTLAPWPAVNLTWMHTSPICNPPITQDDLHHINKVVGQDVSVPNAGGSGVILFMHNNVASPLTISRPTSAKVEDIMTPVTHQHWRREPIESKEPLRSQSAPAFVPVSKLAKTGSHSRSLPHLPSSMQRRAGDNT
ncbi:circadian-associated transcriptional repressor [Discoglossus pictus]